MSLIRRSAHTHTHTLTHTHNTHTHAHSVRLTRPAVELMKIIMTEYESSRSSGVS